MIDEERDLVGRCLDGRESAFHEFVERFQAVVFGVCARMLGDQHEAEDVSQEVFVRALRSLSQWDAKRPLRPWLLTIAANRCRTQLSRRKRVPTPSEYPEDLAGRSEDSSDLHELQAEIQVALGALRPDYRQVFLFFHEQRLSYEDMSRLTGKPIGTLKTWLHRARGEMMAHLRKRGLAPEANHDLSEV